jgi:hypothetical protein
VFWELFLDDLVNDLILKLEEIFEDVQVRTRDVLKEDFNIEPELI